MQYAPTWVRAKNRRVLDANPWRGTFRGVCNTPLHGYVQNLSGSTFPYPDTPKTHPILPFPIRIHQKPALFYTQILRRKIFRGVCFCALHGYMKNLAGFGLKPSAGDIWRRMQYAPTRVHAKIVRFHISAPGYTKNAPDFTFPHPDTPKTHPILSIPIGIHQKRTRFHPSQ